jgi:formylglycine-generating enzyme required for sulfatase activity
MAMGSIFFSYAGADRDIATRLKQGLVAAGAALWQDVDQIHLGDHWIDTLQDALQQCSAYAILLGNGGVKHWVKAELSLALKRHFDSNGGFPIYPLLLPGVTPEDLPPFLSLFQAERLPAEPEADDYRRLAHSLSSVPEVTQPATGPAIAQHICPYPGLEAYDEESARFYFGRQSETLEALSLFCSSRGGSYRRWLQIDGPSGCGKSSLVKAGMIPAIRRGWIEEHGGAAPRDWLIASMRPGSDPVLNLAVALERALRAPATSAGDSGLLHALRHGDTESLSYQLRLRTPEQHRFLLIVDQLEEIFTLVEAAEHRQRFDALLAAALADRDGSLHLITTIRSDFTIRFNELPQLQMLINERAERYYLQPITRTGLVDVVHTPTRLAGFTWSEATLPERIIDDAVQEPAALPLVSNLLQLLWQRRDDHVLSAQVYQELGGVGGALARSADALVDRLGPTGKTCARDLLLGLVHVGRGSADTRRTITRETAVAAAGGDAEAERVLDRLAGGADPENAQAPPGPRLIVTASRTIEGTDEPEVVVDLAHEALLTRWETLQHWINERRDQLEAGDALEEAARTWERVGRPRWSGLPAGPPLKRYRQAPAPSALARAFLRASGRLAAWRRGAIGLVMLVILMSVGFGVFGWWVNAQDMTFALGVDIVFSRLGFNAGMPALVEIEADCFQMGSPDNEEGRQDDERQHEVCVGNFAICKYEVTFDEYDLFARLKGIDLPSSEGWGRGRRPVINVSLHDAVAYTKWLSERTGHTYRLPTKAEWEYAARAGTTTRWSFGDDEDQLGDYAWYTVNADGKTHPVGEKKPNPWGLYDMHGNVWEWVQDCYGDYKDTPKDGKAMESDHCARRVLRGGSFGSPPGGLRSASRAFIHPEDWFRYGGFRCVRVPPS